MIEKIVGGARIVIIAVVLALVAVGCMAIWMAMCRGG